MCKLCVLFVMRENTYHTKCIPNFKQKYLW
uniref:Uncharacterized protein n=1 Tax=Anguilla anguilla TaxID=7936 RepID=A0A0E9SMZ0_ANGAN